jgi:hypothetical protein
MAPDLVVVGFFLFGYFEDMAVLTLIGAIRLDEGKGNAGWTLFKN